MYSIELVGEEKHSFLKYISLDKNKIIDNNNFIFIDKLFINVKIFKILFLIHVTF